MNQLEKFTHGLLLLIAEGYTSVMSIDGCVFVGSSLDGGREELLSSLGWEWDEDRSEWYFLVDTEKSDDYIRGFYINA